MSVYSWGKDMNRQASLRIIGMLGLIFLAMSLVGCRGSSGSSEDPEKLHIRHVVALATEYNAANKKSPSSIEELKKWAINAGKASEEDFNSTRDKQPYGFSSGGMGGMQVYEQSGKGGKVYMFIQGGVAEMTPEQVSNMTKRMGSPAPKGGPPGLR
jgi:hypothetical protein